MNSNEWDRTSNAYEMLQHMKVTDAKKYNDIADKIQFYLLRCCENHLKFRSHNSTAKGLDSSKKHLKKLRSDKRFRQQEWIIEGLAFGTDIGLERDYPNPYSKDLCKSKDLLMVRIFRGLYGENAKRYLMDLAYFIDYCMAYARDSQGELPPVKYIKFLHAGNLRMMFNYW